MIVIKYSGHEVLRVLFYSRTMGGGAGSTDGLGDIFNQCVGLPKGFLSLDLPLKILKTVLTSSILTT